MIEIYLLEALKTFYEEGTLSAAAGRLHMTEPSVSRAMKKLENLLNVTLFEREKNKVRLNETGLLAAEYAIRILESEESMIHHIRSFDKGLHTISIGSCAPGPIMELLPLIVRLYSDMSVTSDQTTEEALITGLNAGDYDLILLTRPLMDDDYYSTIYGTEQLCLSVSNTHPAAAQKTITFSEMNGQNFIMYAKVGFWEDIVIDKMPNSKFYKQEDIDAVSDLATASELPSFSTDITQRVMLSRRNGRVNIPFSDPEAFAQFYLICRNDNKEKYNKIFINL